MGISVNKKLLKYEVLEVLDQVEIQNFNFFPESCRAPGNNCVTSWPNLWKWRPFSCLRFLPGLWILKICKENKLRWLESHLVLWFQVLTLIAWRAFYMEATKWRPQNGSHLSMAAESIIKKRWKILSEKVLHRNRWKIN